MNKSTLYMYPSTLPITASNLLASFESFPKTSKPTSFLSVPYILEMLADVPEGLDILKKLELVSTGGSPLSKDIGDAFVKAGVNLVSRYGSSESGCKQLCSLFCLYSSILTWRCVLSYLSPHDIESRL
jgi:hypothetical protein